MQKERICVVLLTVLCVVVIVMYSRHGLSDDYLVDNNLARLQPVRPCGYILVQRYSGQQGAGIQALLSLQQWTRDVGLPMMIVEPFLRLSVMQIPRADVGPTGVWFSDMFDLQNFNEMSRSEGSPEIVDWPTFSASASRYIVHVKMIAIDRHTDFSRPKVVWTAAPESRKCKMYGRRICNVARQLNRTCCVVRVVEAYWKFASRHSLSSEDVYGTILGGLDPFQITLIFSLWRGPWQTDHPVSSPSPPDQLSVTGSSSQVNKFQDSPKLLQSIVNYQNRFMASGLSTNHTGYVAVMLRAEHSVLQLQHKRKSNISEEMEHCLSEVLQRTSEAQRELGTSDLLVTADVGYYGSGSWNATMSPGKQGNVTDVQMKVQETVEKLYGGRWSFHDWEQSFSEATGGVKDRGYVAALQRGLASNAACLVLLGGGSFQKLALTSYLHHTKTHGQPQCVHLVCMENKYSSIKSMLKT